MVNSTVSTTTTVQCTVHSTTPTHNYVENIKLKCDIINLLLYYYIIIFVQCYSIK